MSMPGPGQRRTEVGEAVASFAAYEGAQKAVSALISAGVPAREIAIVGSGLRSIERVTGRLGYATAARQGAMNGLLLGLIFSAVFVLGNPSPSIAVFVGVMFIGIAIGMLLSIVAYAFMRRRRDYASVTQVLADHYDVTVASGSIHRAREVLGASAARPAPYPGTMPPPSPPAPDPGYLEPPRFGERITPPPESGQQKPESGGTDEDERPPQP